MRQSIICAFIAVLVLPVSVLAAPSDSDQADAPKFVIYASDQDAQTASSLYRILRGDDKTARFGKAANLDEAANSDAEVLVVVMSGRERIELAPSAIELLKKRKIIGIGYGAGALFGELGLEIQPGNFAHFRGVAPKLVACDSRLMDKSESKESFQIINDEQSAIEQLNSTDVIAMHLPVTSPDLKVIDAIARIDRSPNYAAIVRQGNCVLIGIPIPSRHWSKPYAAFVRQICIRMHDRELEEYAPLRREVTEPGTYEIQLDRIRSTERPYEKTMYFRFDSPKTFQARLEHSGSNAVMLMFRSSKAGAFRSMRKDARNEEPLEITMEISADAVEGLDGELCELQITNFGQTEVKGKLTITISDP